MKPVYEWLGIDGDSVVKNSSFMSIAGVGIMAYLDNNGNYVEVFFRKVGDGFERYDPKLLTDSERIKIVEKLHKYGHRLNSICDCINYDADTIANDIVRIGVDKRNRMLEILNVKDYSCMRWDWDDVKGDGFVEYGVRGFIMLFRTYFRRNAVGDFEVYKEIRPIK